MSHMLRPVSAHDAVEAVIDAARQDLGIKWTEVARRAGIAPQTLWRYRKGEQQTGDTTRAIEKVFGWPRGYLDAIAGGEAPPPPERRSIFGDIDVATIPDMTVKEAALFGEVQQQEQSIESLRALVIEMRKRVIELEEQVAKLTGRPETG